MTWRPAGRRAAVLVAAVPMLMTGLYAATAVTAQASPTTAAAAPAAKRVENHCNMPGRVCIWARVTFQGPKGSFSGSNGNWAKELPTKGTQCPHKNWNNCVSSVFNNKSRFAVNLWETIGDKDGDFCVTPMTGYSDFTKHHFAKTSDPLDNAVSADFVEPGASC